MEIKHIKDNDTETLVLSGRLDAYWADHLQDELDGCIRSGIYRIRLDMSGVSYLSSAGIRVLLQIYKQAREINGDFSLINISENVKSVLELSGIEKLLKTEDYEKSSVEIEAESVERRDFGNATFEIYDKDSSKTLDCELYGRPDLLERNETNFKSHDIVIGHDSYSLGIGAFGNGFDEYRDKYGEFIGMCGAASCLPTDGSNKPDFQVASGSYLPSINALSGIVCRGEFGYMCRFDSGNEPGNLTIKELLDTSFNITGADELGLAVIGETAGIVGASLIKSPALVNSSEGIFGFPGIQDCISFTSEKSHNGTLIASFGVASRLPHSRINSYLRSYGDVNTYLHMHSSVFSYQPLMKGRLDLKDTIYSLFEKQSLLSVIHLLLDDREIIGLGDTELVRGAVWISPIKNTKN